MQGIAGSGDTSDLVSLGSMFYQPLLNAFTMPTAITRLSQLRGKRVGIGVEGSGTRFLALALLKANRIVPGGDTGDTPLRGRRRQRGTAQSARPMPSFLSGRSGRHHDPTRLASTTSDACRLFRF